MKNQESTGPDQQPAKKSWPRFSLLQRREELILGHNPADIHIKEGSPAEQLLGQQFHTLEDVKNYCESEGLSDDPSDAIIEHRWKQFLLYCDLLQRETKEEVLHSRLKQKNLGGSDHVQ